MCVRRLYLAIDQQQYDVVAVTGNSMGWYVALACSTVLSIFAATQVIDTTSSLMQKRQIGSQPMIPIVDDEWRVIKKIQPLIDLFLGKSEASPDRELFLSIQLCGHALLGGSSDAIKKVDQAIRESSSISPVRLYNYSAFHTRLQQPIADAAQQLLPKDLFNEPKIALVDGTGRIWRKHSTAPDMLRQYTLNEQIVTPYDFQLAIDVAMKEITPDCVIVTGPGLNISASVARSLLRLEWQGMRTKKDFFIKQNESLIVFSMSQEDQREQVC